MDAPECAFREKSRVIQLAVVIAFAKAGVKVDFKPDQAILSKNGETIAVAKLCGNLFDRKTSCVTSGSAMAAKGCPDLKL